MDADILSSCRRCPRLVVHLAEIKENCPDYHAGPVPPFGDNDPGLLIVGLAPGMHGANRTGRPFTGDYAGILLYQMLHRFGFANKPQSVSLGDGLRLKGCRITNAVKCLPPQNKPETSEIKLCNSHLKHEVEAMGENSAILALGCVAHRAVLLALGLKPQGYPFAHAAVHALPGGLALYDSYHCSRYNTQTKRLSAEMFEAVFMQIRRQLDRR